ncbi:Hypothetical protein NTJ_09581, partial [Nesidiocoris tenuis]
AKHLLQLTWAADLGWDDLTPFSQRGNDLSRGYLCCPTSPLRDPNQHLRISKSYHR